MEIKTINNNNNIGEFDYNEFFENDSEYNNYINNEDQDSSLEFDNKKENEMEYCEDFSPQSHRNYQYFDSYLNHYTKIDYDSKLGKLLNKTQRNEITLKYLKSLGINNNYNYEIFSDLFYIFSNHFFNIGTEDQFDNWKNGITQIIRNENSKIDIFVTISSFLVYEKNMDIINNKENYGKIEEIYFEYYNEKIDRSHFISKLFQYMKIIDQFYSQKYGNSRLDTKNGILFSGFLNKDQKNIINQIIKITSENFGLLKQETISILKKNLEIKDIIIFSDIRNKNLKKNNIESEDFDMIREILSENKIE